ncbi:unnamed protein product [Adineta steineri]|uniref:Uncharacterized protein n=1 Tax=Adineta steineri TaxID=433720 RepID=A0A819WA11_9BILA|nr:unnamed protein product [Adineta steineri]
MPTNTKFCSKWLQNLDNTGRVNSRWLKQGKTTSSFQCIVCNSDNFSCTNGGSANLKRHFNRPKHIQCMKDVFDFTLLTASNNQLLLLSKNKNNNSICVGTGSIDRNTTRIPFVIVEKEQRALTHNDKTMIELKQIHLYSKLKQDQFWFDHKWFVGMHKNYFYILPFAFNKLYGFSNFDEIQSNHDDILNSYGIWYIYIK